MPASGGKINAFIDVNSPYSYFAVVHLSRIRSQLAAHGVSVEYHPFFLGGVMQGSGNQPPWKLPAKAAMSQFDMARAKRYFKMPRVKAPDVFPIMSLLPMRGMVYVKANFAPEKVEAGLLALWRGLWEQNLDISQPEVLSRALQADGLFSADEAQTIVAAASRAENKQGLAANTERALKSGAYGAPWLLVQNSEGVEQPFFGSDRFTYIYEFLGVPYRDVEILGKAAL